MPKVSVIIPVHNQAPYLAECLDSVLAQTLREIEVVCVDDGSNDGSERMLDEYAARDGRVKVIHQANVGVAAARNNGLDAATGGFVAFMDSDDRYPDDGVLADLVRGAEQNGVDICGGSMRTMNGDYLEPEFVFGRDETRCFADYQFEFGFTRYVYRRAFLVRFGLRFPVLRQYEDVPFLVQAMHAAGSFRALAREVYAYRTGHHQVDWFGAGGVRALDVMRGLLTVYDLANEYGYSDIARRSVDRILKFVRERGEEFVRVRDELDAVKGSESYHLGLFLTWPVRKMKTWGRK